MLGVLTAVLLLLLLRLRARLGLRLLLRLRLELRLLGGLLLRLSTLALFAQVVIVVEAIATAVRLGIDAARLVATLCPFLLA